MTKKLSKIKQLTISSEQEKVTPQSAEEILDKAAEKMAEIFVAQADAENNKQSKNKLIKKI